MVEIIKLLFSAPVLLKLDPTVTPFGLTKISVSTLLVLTEPSIKLASLPVTRFKNTESAVPVKLSVSSLAKPKVSQSMIVFCVFAVILAVVEPSPTPVIVAPPSLLTALSFSDDVVAATAWDAHKAVETAIAIEDLARG